jgi:hypothetical protein
VKVAADRTMMNDFSNRFVVAGNRQQTEWRFERPVTILGGTDFELSAQLPDYPNMGAGLLVVGVPLQVEFVFWGYKLARVQ